MAYKRRKVNRQPVPDDIMTAPQAGAIYYFASMKKEKENKLLFLLSKI